MTFSLNSTITVPLGFTVGLDKLNLSLFVRDHKPEEPYAYLKLPEQRLHGNAGINLDPQRADLVNQDQWFAFLHEAVYNENLTLAAKGKGTAHFEKLKTTLGLDKDVRLRGNSFQAK